MHLNLYIDICTVQVKTNNSGLGELSESIIPLLKLMVSPSCHRISHLFLPIHQISFFFLHHSPLVNVEVYFFSSYVVLKTSW